MGNLDDLEFVNVTPAAGIRTAVEWSQILRGAGRAYASRVRRGTIAGAEAREGLFTIAEQARASFALIWYSFEDRELARGLPDDPAPFYPAGVMLDDIGEWIWGRIAEGCDDRREPARA